MRENTSRLIVAPLVTLLSLALGPSSHAAEGYYKDFFMDGGAGLSNTKKYHAADHLELSYEWLATGSGPTTRRIMVSNPDDSNGVLLYPDGSPRFRAIYINGGLSQKHGDSLKEQGRKVLRDFYYNGGSYTGSCAGAFLASTTLKTHADTMHKYLHIWPGTTTKVSIPKSATPYGATIEPNSPLLRYYDFGGDMYIAGVETWYGPFANYEGDSLLWPAGTEVLTRFDCPGRIQDGKPACWAYKTDSLSGRIVVVSNHPEYDSKGTEIRDYMAAILLYALEGNGPHGLKAPLQNGVPRAMNDNSRPGYEKIGDLQYHHYSVDLNGTAESFSVTLEGAEGYDMQLFVAKDTLAFADIAEHADSSEGGSKTLSIPGLSAGRYYVGVKCASTVTTALGKTGHSYTENLGVLNGVPYTVRADWSILEGTGASPLLASSQGAFDMSPLTRAQGIDFKVDVDAPCSYSLTLYDVSGRKVWGTDGQSAGRTTHTVRADFRDLRLAQGFLLAVLKKPGRMVTKKVLLR